MIIKLNQESSILQLIISLSSGINQLTTAPYKIRWQNAKKKAAY